MFGEFHPRVSDYLDPNLIRFVWLGIEEKESGRKSLFLLMTSSPFFLIIVRIQNEKTILNKTSQVVLV